MLGAAHQVSIAMLMHTVLSVPPAKKAWYLYKHQLIFQLQAAEEALGTKAPLSSTTHEVMFLY